MKKMDQLLTQMEKLHVEKKKVHSISMFDKRNIKIVPICTCNIIFNREGKRIHEKQCSWKKKMSRKFKCT